METRAGNAAGGRRKGKLMQDTPELVSVIIPAFNAASTLAAAVGSVLQQTHRQLEVVIVDDGSRDRTGAIARACAAGDRRCRYVRQANTGLAGARNRGIDEARGAFVAFLDADDLYEHGKLERQLVALRGVPDAVALTQLRRFKESDGQKTFLSTTAVPELPAGDSVARILAWEGTQMALFTTALVPRDCLLRVGKFDPQLRTAHDWDLGLRLGSICSFRAVQEPLYLYRKHPGSMSATENIEATLRIHLEVLRRAAARANIPRALRRKAERGRYFEHVRALIYYRRFGAACWLLLAGCREAALFRERQFFGLCREIVRGTVAAARGGRTVDGQRPG